MKAFITGASSGIGKAIAIELSNLGYDLILTSKSREKLEKVKKQIKTNCIIIDCDLTNRNDVIKLYEEIKPFNIDIFVNNAGFGLFGLFTKTSLEKELEMIEVNVVANHILMKGFLQDFVERDKGIILNVASVAGFFPGPKLSTYYSTKNYVLKEVIAINEELKRIKSNVKISVLCPGPVDTNFNKTAKGTFKVKGISPEYVAKYTIKKLFKNKTIIIPTFSVKLGVFFSRFIPIKLLAHIIYNFQDRKTR